MRLRPASFRSIAAGLAALLAACSAPGGESAQAAVEDCRFDPAQAVPLLGPTGSNVAGSINGQPAVLSVSTGLGLTAVLPRAAQRFNLPADPRQRSGFAGPSGPTETQNVTVRSLRVGPQEWTGRSLAVRPSVGADGSAEVFDAMLAGNLLQDTELELDLRGRRVGFYPRRNCRTAQPPWTPASSVPMQVETLGVPVISVRVNGQVVRAQISSGNNLTAMSRALANRLGLTEAQATGSTFRSGGTDPRPGTGRGYRLDEVAVGEEVTRGLPVVVTANLAGPVEMILGEDWLRRRKVWLSYAGRRLFLAPAD